MSNKTSYGLLQLSGSDEAGTAIPTESQVNATLLDAAAGHVYHLHPVSTTEEAWFTVNATLTGSVFNYVAPGGATAIRLTTSPTALFVYQAPVTGTVGQAITWGNPLLAIQTSGVSGTVPVGAIIPYGASTAPSGWLNCDGSAVSRTTYAALFSAIGTTYGAGDGSTTFNVPNLQGTVPLGVQSGTYAMGATGGEAQHTLTTNEMPSHNHSSSHSWSNGLPFGPNVSGGSSLPGGSIGNNTEFTLTINNTGGGAAHNNLQPYVVTNYIIKT